MKKIIAIIVNGFLHCVFRVKVQGRENVPKGSGAILAVNHKSAWDAVFIAATSPVFPSFMAKSELFKNPVCNFFLKAIGAFPVHRGKGDIGAIKSSIKILKSNNLMLIFPEGKRNKDTVAHAKPGVALIANMAQVPVVPAYISGEYKLWHKITVTYGQPYDMSKFGGEKLTGEKLQEVADEILEKIRACKID